MASAYLLTACAGSSGSIEPTKIQITPPPAAAASPCEEPQRAPGDLGGLTGGQQEALWVADRVNLANCGAAHWTLIVWAQETVSAFE